MEAAGLSVGRQRPGGEAVPMVFGPVEIHPADVHAVVDGKPVWFTPKEFAMLLALGSRAGRPVSHDWLHRAVWGTPIPGFKDRSVEVYVVKLRRKLAAASDDYTYIHTHHRVGYRFEPLPVERPVGGHWS